MNAFARTMLRYTKPNTQINDADPSSPVTETLLVIDSERPADIGEKPGDTVHYCPLDRLDADLLARVRPDCVLCRLFGPDIDATLVALALVELGYRGRLCVVAPPLPDAGIVRREIQAQAPGMMVEVITR